MPRWLTRVLARIHVAAAKGTIRLTHKALSEAKALGMEPPDVVEVIAGLTMNDFAKRLVAHDDEDWMYVFIPRIHGTTLYVKVVLRANCIGVSFHEDAESKANA